MAAKASQPGAGAKWGEACGWVVSEGCGGRSRGAEAGEPAAGRTTRAIGWGATALSVPGS